MKIRVTLNIDKARLLSYYQGRVATVIATSCDGRRLRFPASILRPFVTSEGISGQFVLQVNEKGKLLSIDRLSGSLS